MVLLPYRKLHIETSLSQEEVTALLKSETVPVVYNPFKRKNRKTGAFFEGEVSDNRFKISRIITGRDSFLPIITGKVQAGITGTSIEVTLMPYPITILLSVIWILGFVILSIKN